LSESFSHSSNSNSVRPGRSHYILFFWWYSLALVRDFNKNLTAAMTNANLGYRTPRMPMNIRKAFLHHPKKRRLQFTGQTSEMIREVQINLDFAALSKSVDIPTNG